MKESLGEKVKKFRSWISSHPEPGLVNNYLNANEHIALAMDSVCDETIFPSKTRKRGVGQKVLRRADHLICLKMNNIPEEIIDIMRRGIGFTDLTSKYIVHAFNYLRRSLGIPEAAAAVISSNDYFGIKDSKSLSAIAQIYEIKKSAYPHIQDTKVAMAAIAEYQENYFDGSKGLDYTA
jgi:hypothetical protein